MPKQIISSLDDRNICAYFAFLQSIAADSRAACVLPVEITTQPVKILVFICNSFIDRKFCCNYRILCDLAQVKPTQKQTHHGV